MTEASKQTWYGWQSEADSVVFASLCPSPDHGDDGGGYCEVRSDLILVFCKAAWNGMKVPTRTCACFWSPQELDLFQLIREKFRVQISWAKFSQIALRKYQEKGRGESSRQFMVIYYFTMLWSGVTLSDIYLSPTPLQTLARSAVGRDNGGRK